jgi:nucleoid-associated protein YgaU
MKTKLLLSMLAALLLSPLASAESPKADPHVAKAVELRGEAVAAYDAGDYDRAAELARAAKAELALARSGSPLPASYTVRLIPGDRDSLSKIAAYPFVYGKREEWVRLYGANKDRLKHPDDADLILPGEVLLIPSIAGEERKGEWSPEAKYPSLD